MFATRKFSRAPSPYPWLLFHVVRVAQFVSAVVVMSCVSFFVRQLELDNYYPPWTFIVLLAVACCTIASTLVTAFFYHYRTLQPRLSSLINTGLTGLWMLGFALLTWNVYSTLANTCDYNHWGHDIGVMVCRIYKSIETFTITGLTSTVASLLLDLWIIRSTRARGVYNQMGDRKNPYASGADRLNNPHHHSRSISTVLMRDDIAMQSHAGEDQNGFGLAPTYRKPSLEFPEYSHEAKRPYKAQRPLEAERFGYRIPEEQTAYEGSSSRMLDRQFAEHDS